MLDGVPRWSEERGSSKQANQMKRALLLLLWSWPFKSWHREFKMPG
jgi:hypothetical protein